MISYAILKLNALFAVYTDPTWGSGPCGHNTFFFFPPWWEYLPHHTDALGVCAPTIADAHAVTHLYYFLFIGLAIIDMLLRVAGFVAVLSIIAGGFQYVFAGGSPEKASGARRRLYNSLIGLAIALTATALVSFVGKQLGP